MKQHFIFSLFLFFTFSTFASSPPDIQKIISRGKLIVAINSQDYAPFFYSNSKKELVGFDISMSKDIAKRLGVDIEFDRKALSFDDVAKEVEEENADIGMGAISSTLERGLHVSFTHPYLTLNQVLVLNRIIDLNIDKDSNSIYNKIKFAVSKNSAYEKIIKEKMKLINDHVTSNNILPYEDLQKAFKDVVDGKIYAFYVDEFFANNLLNTNKSSNIYVRKETVKSQLDPISVAVCWKNKDLLRWLNLYIQNIKLDGTEEMLLKEYNLKGYK